MIKQIQIPSTCPSCQSTLEQVNSQLFCRNKSCPAQSTKKVEAFVKKMRIKGLGPASISKLGFTNPIEIYETHLDTYVEVLGEKIGNKVYNEVQNSTLTTFGVFLSALSIPLIGDTASKKIEKEVNNIMDLYQFLFKLNIGDKAKVNIKQELDSNMKNMEDLANYMTFGVVASSIKEIVGMGNVCITGKLNDFSNRAKAKEFLEEHGYTVTTTISNKTDYLVCEDGSTSSKSKKAESLGIPVVLIENLI